MKIKLSRKSRLLFFTLAIGLLIFGAWRLPGVAQAGSSAETQLLLNPGFASGGWSPWDNYGAPQLTNSISNNGPWSVQFGDAGYGDKVDDLVGQNINLPINTGEVSLSYWYQLKTNEVAPNADKLCVGLYDTDFSSVYAESCLDIGVEGAISAWKQFTYSLTPAEIASVSGKTVMFGLSFTTDWTLPSQGWVDDASLIVVDKPVDTRLTYLPLVVSKH
jgi:hypothetical protein